MKPNGFQTPRVPLPELRRRVTDEFLALLGTIGMAATTRGHSLQWSNTFPSRAAYRMAVSRLREAGVIAAVNRDGRPALQLTDEGERRLPDMCREAFPWPRQWDGTWYLFTYDVPEEQRAYRVTLQKFLKRLRLGQLQKSVYITPHDIQLQYRDLRDAGGIDSFAFLCTVGEFYGRGPDRVVETAWDMDQLHSAQQWYLETVGDYTSEVASGRFPLQESEALLRDELNAYLAVTDADPRLPVPLWPKNYLGESAWMAHRRFGSVLANRLTHSD